jgi:hypothetical protein
MKLHLCKCGATPELASKTSFSGGGRYKGSTRFVKQEVKCPECQHYIYRHYATDDVDEAIQTWNDGRELEEAREASADKFVFDLENSDDMVQMALARIIKAVEQ